MANFTLSLLSPLPPTAWPAVTRIDVLALEVDQGLAWVKEHADDIAAAAGFAGQYTALYVEPAPAPASAGAQ